MIKQRGIRLCDGWQGRMFRLAGGAAMLATTACAEIEIGSELFKNASRTTGPTGRSVSSSPAMPDTIDPSLRGDPEAFYATGLALWDGGQTLAGVWIAHPEARIARQVRLTNDETGTRVDAAMFLRDPNLSGPRIIVSSEAAERLGLAPNLGTRITIEGLAYGPADTAVATGPETEPASVTDDIESQTSSTDPAEIEVAPVAELTPAAPTTAKTVSADPEPAAASGVDAGVETLPTAVELNNDAGVESGADVQQQDEIVAIPAATEATLPLTSPDASAPAPAPAPAPETVTETDSTQDLPDGIADGRRFIQAGVFGQSENAARLVEKLRAAELQAKAVPLTLGERQFSRVVIGPFQTIAERDAALEAVRAIGLADATPVRG